MLFRININPGKSYHPIQVKEKYDWVNVKPIRPFYEGHTTVDLYASESCEKFYGGMGEGSSFNTMDQAVHVSLYDMLQCMDELQGNGHVFEVHYNGRVMRYIATDIHVVQVDIHKYNEKEN